ncbi:hypothetical protein [Microbacterium immunditiarum]|uniref:Integral membrane protein n=1 Tax=Microbacterium immunditiarum TaxID=337480 RepID=A0A7Y9GQC8_9MICO|nr:hypothetical protein [Microbacterium immunditiarum]NYE20760.1 hypothetical protein [Microbacterium immunditiarum]
MASDVDDLRAQLEELRRENERLREQRTEPVEPLAAASDTAPPRRRNGWRAIVSALCIVIAGILVPVTIVSTWTRAQLVDEATFVQTFAPLADDPGVQELVIEQSTSAINESLDVESFTDDLFDGLARLDLPPAALRALELLRTPAASGLQGLIESTVTRVVESDAFAEVWQRALIASHRALVAAATGDGSGVVTIDEAGVLGIQLGPIVEELKQRLVDRGIGLAEAIPAVDRTIVIAQSDALPLVIAIYNIAVTVGWWLPLIALALFVVGILVARRRSTALLGTGVALALGGAALVIALGAARAILSLNAPALGVAPATTDSIFFVVAGAMRDTAIVATFLGVVIAIAAWLGGRWEPAVRVRTLAGSLTGNARAGLRRWGFDSGAFGDWMHRQRLLVRIVILVLAIVLLFALRPLSVGDIVLAVVLALIVWLIAELLQREPVASTTAAEDESADAATAAAASAVVEHDEPVEPVEPPSTR